MHNVLHLESMTQSLLGDAVYECFSKIEQVIPWKLSGVFRGAEVSIRSPGEDLVWIEALCARMILE